MLLAGDLASFGCLYFSGLHGLAASSSSPGFPSFFAQTLLKDRNEFLREEFCRLAFVVFGTIAVPLYAIQCAQVANSAADDLVDDIFRQPSSSFTTC